MLELINDDSDKDFHQTLEGVAGLRKFVEKEKEAFDEEDLFLYMELVIHAMSEFDVLSKEVMDNNISFRDLLANMWDEEEDDDDL